MEYSVVLALIAILVVTVMMGIGQRSQDRLTKVNDAFDEASTPAKAAISSTGGSIESGPEISKESKKPRRHTPDLPDQAAPPAQANNAK